MRIKPFHLQRAGTLTRAIEDDASLCVVYGEGGGSTLNLAGSATMACIPLRGSLEATGSTLTWSIRTGELLTGECESRAVLLGHANAKWLALFGGRQAWADVLPRTVASGAQLFPDLREADREARRLAIAVARSASSASLDGAVRALADKLAATQAGLREALARCPGRTWANKRQTFIRLQRVRNYINACCDHELDIDELARMANYSPCHFLRTFHAIYQTTPHAFLMEQRLQRAWRLLREGSLAVTEVAMASGFENRSAFSRLFHQRFGVTAQDVRHAHGVPAVTLASPRQAA